jgi:hypothetical protein
MTTINSDSPNLMAAVYNMQHKYEHGFIPKPTRTFNVGDNVVYGSHPNTVVVATHCDNHFYSIKCTDNKLVRGVASPHEDYQVVAWMDLFPVRHKDTNFATESMPYSYTQRAIEGILSIAYNFGLDLDPDYQRGLEWSDGDRQLLIESVFNKVDIGKVLLAKDSTASTLYEVIDGKQRIDTLLKFHQDQFKYKGYYFSQLSLSDRYKFLDHTIQIAVLEKCSKAEKLDAFISLNTRGRDMSATHIKKVIKMRKSLG